MIRFKLVTAAVAGACIAATAAFAIQPGTSGFAPKGPEAKTPEKAQSPAKAKLGEKAPEIKLKDVNGKEHTLSQYTKDGKIVVLEWFNPDCPFVRKHHEANTTMRDLAAKYKDKSVVWIAINSGAAGKQGAGVERNKKALTDFSITYPILMDEDGKIGRTYNARTTPHMFIINKDGVLVYDGAIDNNRSPRKAGDVNYVDKALTELLAGSVVSEAQTRSYGCSVKY